MSGRASNFSARSTSGKILDSDEVDRFAQIYVKGDAVQRIGFAEGDVSTTGSGFTIPREGLKFVIESGDELWLNGEVTNDASKVCLLVTKVV
jgi:hypothetical protein